MKHKQLRYLPAVPDLRWRPFRRWGWWSSPRCWLTFWSHALASCWPSRCRGGPAGSRCKFQQSSLWRWTKNTEMGPTFNKSPSFYCMTESLSANRTNMWETCRLHVVCSSLYAFTRMTLHTNLPSLCRQFLCCSEDLLHRSGNDASGLVVFSPFHGVSLSTSGLAVGKAADIVAIQCWLHQQWNLFKDLKTKWQNKNYIFWSGGTEPQNIHVF